MKIERSEITEETRWVFKCKKCDGITEICEDPDYIEEVMCDYCYEEYEINQ